MTTEQIRTYKNTRPFVPFAIHLGNGREIHVKDPENVMIPQSARAMFDDNDAPGWVDFSRVKEVRRVQRRRRPGRTAGKRRAK